MWRRVSCEQPLDTSQSILRLRGNLNQMFGDFLMSSLRKETNTQPKGNLVHILEPGRGTVPDLFPSWQRDTTRRRPPKLWEELSFLHKPLRPWNSFRRENGFWSWRRVPQFSRHPRVVGGTLKILGRLRWCRASSYPYPQQVSKVNSLWSIE